MNQCVACNVKLRSHNTPMLGSGILIDESEVCSNCFKKVAKVDDQIILKKLNSEDVIHLLDSNPVRKKVTKKNNSSIGYLLSVVVFLMLCAYLIKSCENDDSSETQQSAQTDDSPIVKEEVVKEEVVKLYLQEMLESNNAILTDYKPSARANADDVTLEAALFQAHALLIDEHKDIDSLKSTVAAFKQSLIRRQRSEFPKLRKAYCAVLKTELWVDDYEVSCYGKSTQNVTVIHSSFVTNRNKQTFMDLLEPTFKLLRYKRVNLKWISSDEEYTYYTISSLNDTDVK